MAGPAAPTNLHVAAGLTSTTAVTDASFISWDEDNLTDVYGFKVQVDAGVPIDVGIPTSQTPSPGGGVTFTIPVTTLSLTNGAHTLTFYSYNVAMQLSSSPSTLDVVKS